MADVSSFDIRTSSFSSHLPILEEVIWDFLQEPRWPLEHVAVAAAQTHVWIGEIELVARSRDRDVKQTPFFLQRVARIERAAAGEHSVSQPDHEDSMKLQTFCLVHAGEIDSFFLVCLN